MGRSGCVRRTARYKRPPEVRTVGRWDGDRSRGRQSGRRRLPASACCIDRPPPPPPPPPPSSLPSEMVLDSWLRLSAALATQPDETVTWLPLSAGALFFISRDYFSRDVVSRAYINLDCISRDCISRLDWDCVRLSDWTESGPGRQGLSPPAASISQTSAGLSLSNILKPSRGTATTGRNAKPSPAGRANSMEVPAGVSPQSLTPDF